MGYFQDTKVRIPAEIYERVEACKDQKKIKSINKFAEEAFIKHLPSVEKRKPKDDKKS